MASLVITGSAGNATYTAPVVSMQNNVGQYWMLCDTNAKQFTREGPKAPGQGGHASKWHGFDKRTGFANVVYVAASAAACRTARTADETSINNGGEVSVAIPDGETLSNSIIKDMKLISGPKQTETGNYRYEIRIEFEEVRE